MGKKFYLGDGVYIEKTDDGVRLFTYDGYEEKNSIFLGQEEITCLILTLRNLGEIGDNV